jgi:hypothetical protein
MINVVFVLLSLAAPAAFAADCACTAGEFDDAAALLTACPIADPLACDTTCSDALTTSAAASAATCCGDFASNSTCTKTGDASSSISCPVLADINALIAECDMDIPACDAGCTEAHVETVDDTLELCMTNGTFNCSETTCVDADLIDALDGMETCCGAPGASSFECIPTDSFWWDDNAFECPNSTEIADVSDDCGWTTTADVPVTTAGVATLSAVVAMLIAAFAFF